MWTMCLCGSFLNTYGAARSKKLAGGKWQYFIPRRSGDTENNVLRSSSGIYTIGGNLGNIFISNFEVKNGQVSKTKCSAEQYNIV